MISVKILFHYAKSYPKTIFSLCVILGIEKIIRKTLNVDQLLRIERSQLHDVQYTAMSLCPRKE